MVADKLQRQEEERIQCSPTSNIDNMVEEEMDISTTHHKRKVAQTYEHTFNLMYTIMKIQKLLQVSYCGPLSYNGLLPLTACNLNVK